MRLPPARARRTAFFAYALVLFIATHWPALTIEGPIERPDLVLHLAAFGLWAALLTASGLLAPPRTPRNLARSLAVSLAYAVLDELSQGVPILRRTVGLDDLLANLLGATLGAFAAWLLIRRYTRKRAGATR